MNNTDKLLRAFISASGFEIEETETTATETIKGVLWGTKTIDYKVTKKKPQACFDVDSPEWSCIVDFTLNQADNIEHDIEGYGDLKPMLDYFNGVR